MEEKELNLCDLLKGHEGETFYTTVWGDIRLNRICGSAVSHPIVLDYAYLTKEGKWDDKGECVIFPSKEQRDWSKWAEKH